MRSFSLLVPIIGFTFIAIVVVILLLIFSKKKEKLDAAVKSYLAGAGFNATRLFFSSVQIYLGLDDQTRRLAVVTRNPDKSFQHRLYNYSDVAAAELVMDGALVLRNVRGGLLAPDVLKNALNDFTVPKVPVISSLMINVVLTTAPSFSSSTSTIPPHASIPVSRTASS
jgi:hypothetical protein